jgi:hypothetical protein
MESRSRSLPVIDEHRGFIVRLSVLCLGALALLMLAASPAAADHKHRHKHGHGHGHGHNHYHYYHYDHDDYDDDDGDVVVIVNPRPRYVAPRVVHHYYPQPVYGGPLFNVVIPVEID